MVHNVVTLPLFRLNDSVLKKLRRALAPAKFALRCRLVGELRFGVHNGRVPARYAEA
jgi:hypothetical protein